MIEIAPSMLAADLMHLEEDLKDLKTYGIQTLHFDVMDAHFVPNLSFGPDFCKQVHKVFPEYFLDVHLMMDNPGQYIQKFAQAGAAAITVHAEVLEDAMPVLNEIKASGIQCGLSIKPGTKIEAIEKYLPVVDRILIMTVEPGFGGQKLMEDQLQKIVWLRKNGFEKPIAVDGGVNMENCGKVVTAGADVLVMGTAFFRADDRGAVVRKVKEAV
ncbi:MAG: ribulose-phosphate 3-epimerase [Clostridia bacterium]|nr:ribulose-phosphate 3-epimerase [Clostridia bacterium]MBR6810538.1 ribulose-phosphate 3-epimerase [Clostridia bacterium]